tara:strand:+ start:2734 stop:3093 length:360 start_codon:yes stop_codon:yes gene_type:complete
MSEVTSITGIVKVLNERNQITDKFSKREVVVETNDKYPQLIMIEAHQDNCDMLDGINVGNNVTINYNLRGREWVNPQGVSKYFNTVVLWSIKVNQDDSAEQIPTVPQNQIEDNENDLPF